MALAPEGAVADLVRKTGAGDVLGQHDVDGIAASLGRLYDEWAASGVTTFRGSEEQVVRLSRRERARELAGVFDEVTE